MNQGARDANAESDRIAATNTQQQILWELRRMNDLLVQIANNTSRDGTFTTLYPQTTCGLSENGVG